jgi:mRNA export factor
MSCTFPLLVTAHSEKFCHIWNLENLNQNNFNPVCVFESPLKSESSSLCCFADGKGFNLASIEGRCSVNKVNFNVQNPKDIVTNEFCFKCHRQEEAGKDAKAYTVNMISFNNKHKTFCTAGSDGCYIVWNKDTRARYRFSKPAPQGMSACAFSDDASLIAFASGEDWTKGAEFAKQRPNQV